MKKIAIMAIMAGFLVAGPGMVFAANTSHPGAQTYGWNLSGDVMPVPPYGAADIAGSDTASKLIVNQPNGKVGATVTGVMNGLAPNTTYTVYLSNPYEPYRAADVSGMYTIDVLYMGNHYQSDLTLTQTGNTIGGLFYSPYLPNALPVNGIVTGNNVMFSIDYGPGSIQGVRTFTGTINADGSLSGTWTETGSEAGSGSWSTNEGIAAQMSGSTSWTGQLAGTAPFTFTTNASGSGSWHYNLTAPAPSSFSAWINGSAGTVLVSDDVMLH